MMNMLIRANRIVNYKGRNLKRRAQGDGRPFRPRGRLGVCQSARARWPEALASVAAVRAQEKQAWGSSRDGRQPGQQRCPCSQVLLVSRLLPAAGEKAGLPAREASSVASGVRGRYAQV